MTREQEQAHVEAGAAIREARVAAGLSQETLAMEAGWDQSTLSKVERGGPQNASWKKLHDLASALGCVVEVRFRRPD